MQTLVQQMRPVIKLELIIEYVNSKMKTIKFERYEKQVDSHPASTVPEEMSSLNSYELSYSD